jgi:hypothetical protein
MFHEDQIVQIIATLDTIQAQLTIIQNEVRNMAADLTTISAQVAASVTVEQSAITLINGLANQISLLANDPAALQQLASTLANSAQALSADVVANTPAAPIVPVVVGAGVATPVIADAAGKALPVGAVISTSADGLTVKTVAPNNKVLTTVKDATGKVVSEVTA